MIYQKSAGANIHLRGSQDKGKTLLMVAIYKYLVTKGGYSSSDGVGNLTLFKYNSGFQTLKGDDLHQYLWDLTHKPYRNKIVLIDEIDSEFPARFFQSREQTEIALRLWHNRKLRNYIMFTSHLGNGTDLIFDLASNFKIYPRGVDTETDSLEFTVVNNLDLFIADWTLDNVSEIMGMYDRWEMTEHTEEDSMKERPKKNKKHKPVSATIERDGEEKLRKIFEGLK